MRLHFSALVEAHKSQTRHIQGNQWAPVALSHWPNRSVEYERIYNTVIPFWKWGRDGQKISKRELWLKTHLIAQWISATWVNHLNQNRLAALFQVEPIHPWKLCGKTCFEASRVVFWSPFCYKDLKLTTKPFTGSTLHGLLIQTAKLLACKVQACTGSKILGFKSDTAVLTFTFCSLSSPRFSLFSPHFVFLLLGI